MKRPGFLILLMALAAVYFGFRAYRAWTEPVVAEAPPLPGPAASPAGISPSEPPRAADLSTPVASIVARPVFRPDRRPFQENAAIVPARNYELELNRFTLLGVLLLGDTKKAVVTGKSTGRPERYEVVPGESLPGFEVKDVREEGVILTADGKEFLLPLYAGAPKAQGTGGLRTDVAPRKAPASPSAAPATGATAGTVEPGKPPARAEAPVRGATAAQPPAAVTAPAQPGTASPAPQGRPYPYRGRNRPTYVPGQR